MSIKLAVPCLLLLVGPAVAAESAPVDVPGGQLKLTLPEAIAAPDEQPVTVLNAEGAQIYECKAAADGKFAWSFREPIATLLSDGKTVGRHYAGPSWEYTDGSVVVGKAIGNAPGATVADIPWLKLEVTARRGNGVLTPVTTVQRLSTQGGKLDGACEKVGEFRSVPYSAVYVFKKKP